MCPSRIECRDRAFIRRVARDQTAQNQASRNAKEEEVRAVLLGRWVRWVD